MTKANPIKEEEKVLPDRVEPDIETDSFGPEEEKEINKMVVLAAESGIKARQEWQTKREKDLQHYNADPPSKLEQLNKYDWMSDRNLGLCPAVCDIFQATLLATTLNFESIGFKATEKNDVDNRDNLTRFAKWMVSPAEINMYPEADEFVFNKITQGISFYKVYWKIWYDWVDKYIPQYDKDTKDFTGYKIKTENERFEQGVIENMSNVDDIIAPNYGKTIEKLPYIIQVIHLDGADLLEMSERKIFVNLTEEKITQMKEACYQYQLNKLGDEKCKQLGIMGAASIDKFDLRDWPVDIYEWYGKYKKNKRNERYRFHVEPKLGLFLSGKPLRKIKRDGKYPFIGRPFIRLPGKLLGKSLPELIAPIVNAFNNVFNQKSDFQYQENCPGGWFKPDEQYTKQEFIKEPGKYYPTDDPSAVVDSGGGRSMAWAVQDIQILFEMLERLTGSASYFMSTNQKDGTATRDVLVNEKSETRFGKWAKTMLLDHAEAIGDCVKLYQDKAPKNLGERILGKDGEQILANLSIQSLRGNYDAFIEPDIIAGSRTLEKQLAQWGVESLSASPWMDPKINPKGSWKLWVGAAKKMGMMDAEQYFPPEPPLDSDRSEEAEQEFHKMKQGERIDDPPEGQTPAAMNHFITHMRQKSEEYHKLDEEYRPNFDAHLFKTQMNVQGLVKKMQQEQQADQLAQQMIQNKDSGIAEIPE